jgi:hypothetical protein
MPSTAIGRYTGNGVNGRQITGLGFSPTGVIILHEGVGFGYASWLTPSFPGSGVDTASGSGAMKILSLDADGFTLGDNGAANGVNANGIGFSWVAFRDDAAANFNYGTYTGDGAPTRQITTGFTPTMVWVGYIAGPTIHWQDSLVTYAYNLVNTVIPITGWIDGSWASGFVASGVNFNGRVYYWMAWKTAQYFCDQGKYTGNNTDDRDIGITAPTWQPKIVNTFCRQSLIGIGASGVGRWHHDEFNTGDSTQYWVGGTGTSANAIQKKNINGFQIGTEANINYLNETYDWFCFAGTAPATQTAVSSRGRPGYSGIGGNPGEYEIHKTIRKAMRQFNNLILGD